MTYINRRLGRSGIDISAMGIGCWAIGGPAWRGDTPTGWGHIDDDESIRALSAALDAGVTFFDTADAYGAGHSERVIGKAFSGKRDSVVIATEFGNVIDEEARQMTDRKLKGDQFSPITPRERALERPWFR